MEIIIGRTSGSCTDRDIKLTIQPEELDLVKDIIAVVNRASNNKEKWYVETPEYSVVPIINRPYEEM